MGMKPSLDVHIEELVLEGSHSRGDEPMREAVRREIERRLSASPIDAHAAAMATAVADAVHEIASGRTQP